MANEKIARLATGEITFFPLKNDGTYGDGVVLGYNQKVALNRTSETKELLSNDESLGQSVAEIETKVEYEFSTETGDLKIDALAICFKGLVEAKTYKAGDVFWNGKTIKPSTEALAIGDICINDNKIYTATQSITANNFSVDKCAPKAYKAVAKYIKPEARANNIGKIVVDGENLNSGQPQVLIIPKINLKFDGEFTLVGDDFAKVALKGKCLKKGVEDLFMLLDGEMA